MKFPSSPVCKVISCQRWGKDGILSAVVWDNIALQIPSLIVMGYSFYIRRSVKPFHNQRDKILRKKKNEKKIP